MLLKKGYSFEVTAATLAACRASPTLACFGGRATVATLPSEVIIDLKCLFDRCADVFAKIVRRMVYRVASHEGSILLDLQKFNITDVVGDHYISQLDAIAAVVPVTKPPSDTQQNHDLRPQVFHEIRNVAHYRQI